MLLLEENRISAASSRVDAVLQEASRQTKQQDHFIEGLIADKKARRKKEATLRLLALSIGLCLSLAFIDAMFEWKTYGNGPVVQLSRTANAMEELLDVQLTKQPPPPPPKQVIRQPNVIEVQDDEVLTEEINVDFDVEINTEKVLENINYDLLQQSGQQKKETAEDIFTIVETQPTPKSGMAGFYKYVSENLKYPERAVNAEVEGKVFVQFVVNVDGRLTDFKVIRGIGMGCDEEAVRVLSNAEPWNPGKQRGKRVRVRLILPITFRIIR